MDDLSEVFLGFFLQISSKLGQCYRYVLFSVGMSYY